MGSTLAPPRLRNTRRPSKGTLVSAGTSTASASRRSPGLVGSASRARTPSASGITPW